MPDFSKTLLERIALAVEALAKKADPEFKTLDELKAREAEEKKKAPKQAQRGRGFLQ